MSARVKRKHYDERSILCKKKIAARERWQILAATLQGGCASETQQSVVSVRRFQTFGFLKAHKCDNKSVVEDNRATWYQYTCRDYPELCMNIRHVCDTIRPEDLLGFNNTGNVCVWPSEEVMTYYCLQHLEEFRGSMVIEIGGGMTCLSAVALALNSEADSIVMSDGNEHSVSNLHEIIQENDFGGTAVSARMLRWGPDTVEHDHNLQEAFDFVLCADCLFFEGREHLVTTIFSLLKPGGVGLVFAPSRSGTFDKFCDLAKSTFVIDRHEKFDDLVWNAHLQLKCSSPAYTEDLHYPLLVKLHKPSCKITDSRDTTPESR